MINSQTFHPVTITIDRNAHLGSVAEIPPDIKAHLDGSIGQKIAALKLANIANVYSGKTGKCCCGCSGTYRYASAHVDAAAKRRGYAISSDEISDRQVRRIFNLIVDHRYMPTAEIEDSYVAVEIGRRLYIAYFEAWEGAR